MQPDEQALAFACGGEPLVAILSPSAAPAKRGVLIIVGGPQYRAGSHRQFALLARDLAAQGIPAMRFDYRGMGDSGGDLRNFEMVQDDLRAAVDAFLHAVPGLQEVVLWGLCDAASAAMFHAHADRRVAGLVLLNPWARTEDGLARATLKHYYRDRLLQPALWKKIVSGQFDFRGALRSFAGVLGAARGKAPADEPAPAPEAAAPAPVYSVGAPPGGPGLHGRMLEGMQRFGGPVLFIFSGADLTAQEFLDMTKASRRWQDLLAAPRVQQQTLQAADHTFSRREWRDQVAAWTGEWVRAW
ncbi:hydrolase 1, exosortase A system-associated [Pseudoduganella sp. UC29_106]|uniref:hydrolase 1, exosortase A system-associated n=1 Tax=Pseudoduganella sp. UC29_106 TaxID=3374553 RepID=UPI003757EF12